MSKLILYQNNKKLPILSTNLSDFSSSSLFNSTDYEFAGKYALFIALSCIGGLVGILAVVIGIVGGFYTYKNFYNKKKGVIDLLNGEISLNGNDSNIKVKFALDLK